MPVIMTRGQNLGSSFFRFLNRRLALFSTYAQFGAAEEVALSDMKIELMFPADAEAMAVLEALAE